jgi:hypothetical protein
VLPITLSTPPPPATGSHLCTSCSVTITRTKGTECSACRRFRDGCAPRKQREAALKTYLDKAVDEGVVPAYTSHDKCATSTTTNPLLFAGPNRPDFLWKLDTHWVVLEVDEAQHKGKTYSCERRRELEICNCAGGLPVVFVRFNPDTFCTGSKSARVKVSAESIPKRHAAVVAAVGHAVANVAQGLTFVKLYFDCSCIASSSSSSSSSSSDHPCGFSHTTTYKDHEAFLMDFQ